ncbi:MULTISPECIES: hypothetical protein [unclassified Polaromonas]|uniref:hypothetical protein n=1 Tax=unclassified Polaromonas TaxID=2638319 RepID=UPI0018CAA7D5|nr:MULTISPECIES: hypothetical protein [unclassified Polaromonas]MBG6070544.1 hypothetical protein [Polaromonas sp. CG_9.7]MBG6112542.1 hypothetical protein [Polaromonas sp. CG_9.2]MDH6184192.1 hypothetical protein [Polaromonas sp. CG_23.6]
MGKAKKAIFIQKMAVLQCCRMVAQTAKPLNGEAQAIPGSARAAWSVNGGTCGLLPFEDEKFQ